MTLHAYDVCCGDGGEQAAASWAMGWTFFRPDSVSAHGGWATEIRAEAAEQGCPCQSFFLSFHSLGSLDPELLRPDHLLGIAACAEPKHLRLFCCRPVSTRSVKSDLIGVDNVVELNQESSIIQCSPGNGECRWDTGGAQQQCSSSASGLQQDCSAPIPLGLDSRSRFPTLPDFPHRVGAL